MECKKCGEDDELVLMVTTANGESRYLCQRCGEMN
jgi:hypothetical protein